MDRDRFSVILKEYNFNEKQIELLWNSKPDADIDEEKLRKTAAHLTDTKDLLVQA